MVCQYAGKGDLCSEVYVGKQEEDKQWVVSGFHNIGFVGNSPIRTYAGVFSGYKYTY